VSLLVHESPHLIEASDAYQMLDQDNCLVISLCRPSTYKLLHIPGAVSISPSMLLSGKLPASGSLPEVGQIVKLLNLLGYKEDRHILIYDEGDGWAGRMAWTLEIINHTGWSYINGGLHAWMSEKLPVSNQVVEHQNSYIKDIVLNLTNLADKNYILSKLYTLDLVLWDSRSNEEYSGAKCYAMQPGHIPGAVHLEWSECFNPDDNFRIHRDLVRIMGEKGISCNYEVITYCHTNHRSAFTWMLCKILGFPRIKAYDGGWAEWGSLSNLPCSKSI